MRLISIRDSLGEEVIINTEQICRIYESSSGVVITTGDDANTITQFTDVMSAVDYIQRVASVSKTG
tara:strand:+ start:154 stop:351 length:198 start_codon:yes stop_codon:yes gene_type:complete